MILFVLAAIAIPAVVGMCGGLEKIDNWVQTTQKKLDKM